MASTTDLAGIINADGSLDVDKLEIVTLVPPGDYVVKLVDVKVTEPTKNLDGSDRKEQIEAMYEVLEGKFKSRTIKHWYSLEIKPPTEPGQKANARGIADIVTAIRNIGGEITKVPALKPMEMRKLVATHLGKKRLKLRLDERAGTGQYAGKSYKNVRINGLADPKSSASPDDLAGGDESESSSTSDELV